MSINPNTGTINPLSLAGAMGYSFVRALPNRPLSKESGIIRLLYLSLGMSNEMAFDFVPKSHK